MRNAKSSLKDEVAFARTHLLSCAILLIRYAFSWLNPKPGRELFCMLVFLFYFIFFVNWFSSALENGISF